MPVTVGAIVPHAPVLALESGRLRPTSEVMRAAVESLTLDECDVIVIASPHGRTSGVYSEITGSLDGFGVHGRSVRAPSLTDLADELARQWKRPVIGPPADHGIVGALLIAGRMVGPPLVAAAFRTITGPGAPGSSEGAIDEARSLAEAVTAISAARRVGFVASAHTSASLSSTAPLLDRPEGHELEERVLAALRRDPVELAGIEHDLWRAAGACGAGPLTTFGLLFAGRPADLIAYDTPVGIGYLVAQVLHS